MKRVIYFLSVVSIAAGDLGAAENPNFVVIFTDDQGYQDIGCFGSPDIRTPRLDAMAKQGMKFTSFYAQPVCGPSRAALMTGCYPMRVAERGHTKQVHPILHEEEITIAEVLKTKGYATACFGKWDLAKHAQTGFFMDLFPTRQGFDYFYGTPTSNDRVANLYRDEKLIEPASDMATLTQRYTDEAISFIRKNQDRPFFVYIPHTMPHTRLDASAKFKGKSDRGLYGDVIEEIDFNVGRILDALDELKLAENTYVLFTSDNGPWLIKNKDHADGHLQVTTVDRPDRCGAAKCRHLKAAFACPRFFGDRAECQPIRHAIPSPRQWTLCQHFPLLLEPRLRPTASSTAKTFDISSAVNLTRLIPTRRTSITFEFTCRRYVRESGSCICRGRRSRSVPLRSAAMFT